MSSRDLRKVMKRLEELEMKEMELSKNYEEECEENMDFNELQMENRKKSRMLLDVRLRIKCLKKNYKIIDQNENIAGAATLNLLSAEEKKQKAEQYSVDKNIATKEIYLKDVQFEPQDVALEVWPEDSGISLRPNMLLHSKPRHQGISSRSPVRIPRTVESDIMVGQVVNAEGRETKPDSTVAFQVEKNHVRSMTEIIDILVGDMREDIDNLVLSMKEEFENLVSGSKEDLSKMSSISATDDVGCLKQQSLEKARRGLSISSNQLKCLRTKDSVIIKGSTSSLPAAIQPKGRGYIVKNSPRTSSVKSDDDCTVCNRRTHLVFCTSPTCVHSVQGRLSTTWCDRHPNNCHLVYKTVNCPVCKSPLVEQKVLNKTDRDISADLPGTKVLSKTDKVLVSDQSGPLLGLPIDAGSVRVVKYGTGDSYRERAMRVLKNINKAKKCD